MYMYTQSTFMVMAGRSGTVWRVLRLPLEIRTFRSQVAGKGRYTSCLVRYQREAMNVHSIIHIGAVEEHTNAGLRVSSGSQHRGPPYCFGEHHYVYPASLIRPSDPHGPCCGRATPADILHVRLHHTPPQVCFW